MKVAIYSPYLDTLGGGEKYIATIAEILSREHSVDLLLDKHLNYLGGNKLKLDLENRFDLNLEKVKVVLAPIGSGSDFYKRIFFLKRYDLLIYLTDGSIFYSTARKNILHIQSPLVGQPAKSKWGRIKLNSWDKIIYNSSFTKDNAKKNWPIASIIIYPPVDTSKIKPLKKKKYILSVGRFFGYLKDKKHEFLIKAFVKLKEDKEATGWSLHLAGSASDGDKEYLNDLKQMAKNVEINFYPNLGYDDLIKLYGESSIYWHASGYQEEDPTKMEHFGIATVEAMAAGCVPVVIGRGGQLEIVDNNKNGFLWNDLDDLEDKTLKLMENQKLWQKMSSEGIKKSSMFSKENFEKNIKKLISTI